MNDEVVSYESAIVGVSLWVGHTGRERLDCFTAPLHSPKKRANCNAFVKW